MLSIHSQVLNIFLCLNCWLANCSPRMLCLCLYWFVIVNFPLYMTTTDNSRQCTWLQAGKLHSSCVDQQHNLVNILGVVKCFQGHLMYKTCTLYPLPLESSTPKILICTTGSNQPFFLGANHVQAKTPAPTPTHFVWPWKCWMCWKFGSCPHWRDWCLWQESTVSWLNCTHKYILLKAWNFCGCCL